MSAGERCGGRWNCILPAGHNMGQADVPSNHRPMSAGDERGNTVNDKPYCCDLSGTDHDGPIYELITGPGIDDNTHMCAAHVGYHVNDTDFRTSVYPVEWGMG